MEFRMRKTILLLLIVFFCGQSAFGAHLKGGWIQYTYIGPGATANTSRYQITVRQYLACNSTSQQRDAQVFLGVFDGASNQLIRVLTIPLSGTQTPNKTTYDPCLSVRPPSCYIIDMYSTTVELPNLAGGYTLTSQRCCRVAGIVNLQNPSNNYGISYTARIPGTIGGNNYFNNSSPSFAPKDTVVVCYNAPFTLDFSATDNDGDSLVYTLCSGLTGGFNDPNNSQNAAQPNPPSNPPYTEIGYSSGYTGSTPLGLKVAINSNTGIISGIAPGTTGDYVLSVCANEYRNGIQISSTKKEIHVTVGDCTVAGAQLQPTYVNCDAFTLNFQNESASSNITNYAWDFGDKTSSSQPTPSHTYSDTGTYTLKLKVTNNNGCADSTTAVVRVYPGFVSDFVATGTCVLNAYQFKDATISKYGTVNSWYWDFGDNSTLADSARNKDSAWKYSVPDTVMVTLISTDSKGCVDTVTKNVAVLDRPQLSLPFRDTLICSIDTLALRVLIPPTASVVWTPRSGPNQSRILNPATATPLVFPRDTTRYYVSVNDNGCANSDSVTVNVLQFITVSLKDTGICRTDTMQLRPVTDALSFSWSSSTGEIVTAVKYPLVRPLVDTRYTLTANLGKCQASASMLATVNPYPVAAAGADQSICFGTRTQLSGTITGNAFNWSPTGSLGNANSLTPTAAPLRTTAFVLTATNITGCLKPVSDTVLVTVIQPIIADAGRDTIALPGQALQLQATGGTNYLWRPTTGLSDPTISNPIAILDKSIDSIVYTVRVSEGDCYADDDIKVRVFKTGPDILVPSAFTPNADGKNDVVHATLIGIQKLSYFSIYNRWGQLVFTTSDASKGWNGNFNGLAQPSGTYVYQALGIDFKGSSLLRKGTLVLIR
jgi:gliding motility-associated-like protein